MVLVTSIWLSSISTGTTDDIEKSIVPLDVSMNDISDIPQYLSTPPIGSIGILSGGKFLERKILIIEAGLTK